MKKNIRCIVKAGFFILMLILVIVSANCGKSTKPPPPPEPTAAELTAEGWQLFESNQFANAKPKFSEALGKDGEYADAYNGRGWCNAFLYLDNEAISDFDSANSKGLGKQDAHAGLAGIHVGNQESLSAINSARTVLSQDSSYQFSHKPAIDSLDLHLILAQAYYGLGGAYLDSAQQRVDYLNPANDLDPTNPATWIVSGVTYDTYAEALLKEIQRLEESIGGY